MTLLERITPLRDRRPGPGSIYLEAGWREVIESTYRVPQFDVGVPGVRGRDTAIPVCELRSVSGERVGISLPYSNYGGGVCTHTAPELFEAAARLAAERGWSYLEIKQRGPGTVPSGWQVVEHFVSPVIDVAGLDESRLWTERVGSKARNQTRLAERHGLVIRTVDGTRDREFQALYTEGMRDLGTPAHGRSWFEALDRHLGDRLIALVVRTPREGAGVALLLDEGRGGILQYCLSLRRFRSHCPNHLLYWESLRLAAARGWDYLDLGRSRIDGGTHRFKRQWGAVDLPTPYAYCIPAGSRRVAPPDQHPSRPGFRVLAEAWKRLPLPVSRFVGPRVRGHITT